MLQAITGTGRGMYLPSPSAVDTFRTDSATQTPYELVTSTDFRYIVIVIYNNLLLALIGINMVLPACSTLAQS